MIQDSAQAHSAHVTLSRSVHNYNNESQGHHFSSTAEDSSIRDFPCEHCDRAFSDPITLQHHIRAFHAGARAHACPECGKTFATSSGLKQHQHIHSTVKPFQCEVCLKAYTQFSNLCRHKRMHADCRQQIKCKDCGQAFSTMTSLGKHKRFCQGAIAAMHHGASHVTSGMPGSGLSSGFSPKPMAGATSDSLMAGYPSMYMSMYGSRHPFPFFPTMGPGFPMYPTGYPASGVGTSASLLAEKAMLSPYREHTMPSHIPQEKDKYMLMNRNKHTTDEDTSDRDNAKSNKDDIQANKEDKVSKRPFPFADINGTAYSFTSRLLDYGSRESSNQTKESSDAIRRCSKSPRQENITTSSERAFDLSRAFHTPSGDKSLSSERETHNKPTSDTKTAQPLDLSSKSVKSVTEEEVPRKTHIFGGEKPQPRPTSVTPEAKKPFQTPASPKRPSTPPYRQESKLSPIAKLASPIEKSVHPLESPIKVHDAYPALPAVSPAMMSRMYNLERSKLEAFHEAARLMSMSHGAASARYPYVSHSHPFAPMGMLPPFMTPNPISQASRVPPFLKGPHTFPYAHNGMAKSKYACKFCGKIFPRSANLTRHLRTHTGEQPYKCKYCERSFSISSNLQRHIRNIHNKEKPYKCPICDRCFGQQTNLDRHLKKHELEGPNVCDSPSPQGLISEWDVRDVSESGSSSISPGNNQVHEPTETNFTKVADESMDVSVDSTREQEGSDLDRSLDISASEDELDLEDVLDEGSSDDPARSFTKGIGLFNNNLPETQYERRAIGLSGY